MTNDSYTKYWDSLAAAFIHPIQSEALLGRFVTSPTLTGLYAESWVRWLVRSMARNYEVSTGAIIRSSDQEKGRRGLQCDLIVWDPTELPSPLAIDDFALVPSFSARALIEVKRTTSDPDDLRHQLVQRRKALPPQYGKYVLGVVVKHGKPLFPSEQLDPDWVDDQEEDGEPAITRLMTKDNQPDTDGILALIYMLAHLAGHRGALGSWVRPKR